MGITETAERLTLQFGENYVPVLVGPEIMGRIPERVNRYPHVVLMVGSSARENLSGSIPDFSGINGLLTEITLNEDINLKNIRNYQKIVKVLIERKVPKESVIVAVGPQDVLDLAGFVAATFRGGTRFITVPTTPLAQLSKSVGGVYGLNFSSSSNTIAARYFPCEAYLDSIAFSKGDREHLKDYIVELVRLGALKDTSILNLLESFADLEELRKPENLHRLTIRALNLAPQIICRKESEMDPNVFGNSLGELITQVWKGPVRYYRLMALSMILESYLADRSGISTRSMMERMRKILEKYSIDPLRLRDIGQENLMKVFREAYPDQTSLSIFIPWSSEEKGTVSLSHDRLFSVMRSYVETYELSA